ncbi:membrane protein [Siccirubricoccus deserti]|nr:membrane protein [Siccirubricoccus deserti]
MELLARLGYAARGTVSLIIGLLALLAALGRGGGTTGSKGALLTLLSQPLGNLLLAAVALGLFGFSIWRALQSVLDADGLGTAPKAIVIRFGQAVSAAIYFSLGVFAVSLLAGWGYGSGNEEQSAQDWTAWLLAHSFGRWLVGAVGLAIAGAGLGMAYKAWTASFKQHLGCGGDTARWVVPLGRAGYAARALVFLIIGAFLVAAAYQSDPSEARGLGGALLALQEQPFGRALFGLVALGLAAFGAFEFVEARYRHIAAPEGAEIGKVTRAGLV